ncbi:MAG: DUF2868 domain-containing protein [Betaproteobacteria bacterium]|nr:DUF2868 domain-containing protein [Betaproteobacteria bacterium]
MDETAARQVLLVRAAEAADAASALLTEDDRRYAARAAAELVRWRAADRGERASAEAFVAKRAELLAAKLIERSPRTGRALGAMRWRPWIGIALPAIALASGLVAEHIADPGRVNILAFPLLGIIVWNLAVYVWLLVRTVRAIASRSRRQPGRVAQLLSGVRRNLTAHVSGPLAGAAASFALDWGERSAPLIAARAARILHLSAVALALGAVIGLFLRGLAFEYRAGWESTFLDAPAVHGLLAFFLGPTARFTGQPFPSVEEIAALRWDAGGGENAARWIYLYAVTTAAAVIVPRLILAAIAWLRERRLSSRFPLSLDEAYFRRLLSGWREAPARVDVMPYAYTPAENARQGLQRLAAAMFGDDVQVHWARGVAFGDEDALGAAPDRSSPAADMVVALFNLAATPETENHGVFLDRLCPRTPGRLAVIVDEGPYRSRLGAQAGADARLAERRQAWSGLAATRGARAVFVDLTLPELTAAQRELDAQLTGRTVSA